MIKINLDSISESHMTQVHAYVHQDPKQHMHPISGYNFSKYMMSNKYKDGYTHPGFRRSSVR